MCAREDTARSGHSRPSCCAVKVSDRSALFSARSVAGLALAALGVLVTFAERLPFKLGRLPGDIVIQGKNSTFYFPLMTCVIVSLVLSLVMWLLRR